MIDWGIVGSMWLGYLVTILVLVILSLVAWVTGIIIQRTKYGAKPASKGEK